MIGADGIGTGGDRADPIEGPAAWTGGDLAARTDWIHVLTPDEIAERTRAAIGVSWLRSRRWCSAAEDAVRFAQPG